jgi:hypothetical protein
MTRAIATLLMVLLFQVVHAQDTKKPQEPEYSNSFFVLEKDGTLKPLERQAAKIDTKVKGLGFGGADSRYVVSNEHSSVRFAAGTTLQFIVRPEPSNVDPATIVQIYSFKVGKGQREVQVAKARVFSGAKSTLGNTALQFDVRKYGESSVLLTLSTPLGPANICGR